MSVGTIERPKKTRQRPPSEDPVTGYSRRVVSGEIVSGRAVRQGCQRHLDDLTRQHTEDFPYYFDPAAAQHVIDFFPAFLTLEDGEAFVLPDWLQFSYGCIFGWKRDSDNERRFQYGFFETSKGSGKTPSGAGIGLYVMVMERIRYAEIYSAAFDKVQAAIILNDAIRMANASEELKEELDIGKYNIANLNTGSFFRAVSSEHRGKSGPRPYLVLGDEIHEHRDGRVINKLTAGFKHHTQPLAMLYTNSGSDKTSLCWEYHAKSMAVLEGTQRDEQWFAYVCHLDPCDACYADGYRQPKDGCERCDDWTDPKVWPKVAPALGTVIQPKYLQDAVDMALTVPSEFSLKRRLNFCIWTESHQVWIPPDQWTACQIDSQSQDNAQSRPCAAGLDLSSKFDLSALVIAIRYDDPPTQTPADTVVIQGKDESGQPNERVITLNFSVELIPKFWIPSETLIERVKTERIPYDVWLRRPGTSLEKTDGPIIDHQTIYDHVLKAWKTFKVQRLGYDPKDATMLANKLSVEGRLGKDILEVGQGKKLSEVFKLMEALIRSKRLRHNGDPVLAWCFANAEPQRDRLSALWIEKPSETKRIDGVIASAMAIHQLMVLPAKPQKPTVFFLGGR